MDNIAILGASYFQLPLIEKAHEMGYITHVFAWARNDVGEQAADFFYPISITEKERILEQCRKIGICGICSIASDVAVNTVNYVANELGLVGNTYYCSNCSTNKFLMRSIFKEKGDPSVSYYYLVSSHADISNYSIKYPVIVKPTDRSGSRGVCRVDNEERIVEAVNRAISESFEKKAIIEEYIEGDEYSVEGISYRGNHKILAITKKITTDAPFYIEKGQIEPAPLDELIRKKIIQITAHALDSLDVKNGASHTEIRINSNERITIMEVASRMGGDCIGSDLVRFTTGIDYVKAVIDIACGKEPDLSSTGDVFDAEVRFVLTNDDLIEFNRIRTDEPDRLLRVVDDKHLDLIGKVTDSSNRAACYIVKR